MTQEEILEYVTTHNYDDVTITEVEGNPNISQVFNEFIWNVEGGGTITLMRTYDEDYNIISEEYSYGNN